MCVMPSEMTTFLTLSEISNHGVSTKGASSLASLSTLRGSNSSLRSFKVKLGMAPLPFMVNVPVTSSNDHS